MVPLSILQILPILLQLLHLFVQMFVLNLRDLFFILQLLQNLTGVCRILFLLFGCSDLSLFGNFLDFFKCFFLIGSCINIETFRTPMLMTDLSELFLAFDCLTQF